MPFTNVRPGWSFSAFSSGTAIILGGAMMALLCMGQPARADVPDNDPAFSEYLFNSCVANCGSVTVAQDPVTGGLMTLEYIFNATIPSIVAGDIEVKAFNSPSVIDVIRFEDILGVAVAFIYSNDQGGGQADVGLPSPLQATTFEPVSGENSSGFFMFTPTSSEPGFCATCVNANKQSIAITYGVQHIPEPASLALLGSAIAGFGIARRRRRA